MSSNRLTQIAAYVFIVSFVMGVSWLVFRFISLLSEVEKNVQASLIAATVALISIAFAYWRDRSKAIKEAHREKKIEIYSVFLDMIFNMIIGTISKGESSEYLDSDEFKKSMLEFKKNLMLYGSPSVVKKFEAFQSSSGEPDQSPLETLNRVENIVLAIRKDIGLSNFGLNEGDLIRSIITDYDDEVEKAGTK